MQKTLLLCCCSLQAKPAGDAETVIEKFRSALIPDESVDHSVCTEGLQQSRSQDTRERLSLETQSGSAHHWSWAGPAWSHRSFPSVAG